MKRFIPWPLKIAAKLVLSRLPVSYARWSSINLFKDGDMADPRYSHGVFRRHVGAALAGRVPQGITAVELGPGDSAFSALTASAHGVAKIWLVDAADHARRDVESYQRYAEYLRSIGLDPPDLHGVTSFEAILERAGAHYLTGGLASLHSIPDESVDFVWSHAVLEHVRLAELPGTLRETRRFLRPGGIGSHRIDLQDHLNNALNNLRFSESLWESDVLAESGFYTNRLRYGQLLDQFEKAGFTCHVVQLDRWETLPTPRRALALPYKTMDEADLRVSGFDVVVKPV